MEFICLAAGRGTRFGRLGAYLQKAMYPVGLRPFVAYSVRNLMRSTGFDPARDRLTFVVGHHEEQVRAYFGDVFRPEPDDLTEAERDGGGRTTDAEAAGIHIRYVTQPEPLGTGHALHVATQARLGEDAVREGVDPREPVIAWLADLYVPAELFSRVRAHPLENALAIGPDPHHDNPNVAVTQKGERLARVWRGAGPLYDIGLWKVAPAALTAMLGREVDEFRALPALQREIDGGRATVGWLEADEWLHLGGTAPSPEENVRDVVRRVFELERPGSVREVPT